MTLTTRSQAALLHVLLLGEFRLQIGETAVSGLDTPSHQSLFAYLILNRDKVHTRQQLAYQFWPDSTEAQARTNLRKAIYQLRRHVPLFTDILRVERHMVQWLSDAPVWVDVVAFTTAVSHAQQAQTTIAQKAHLHQAIACYQGEFLPGHYEEWVLAAREQMHQHYLCCLEQLIQLLAAEQDYPAAITFARQLLRTDPLHEAAYRRLMRLQAQNGRVAAALRTYHTCNTTLQNELGVSPSPTTQAIYEHLLQTNAPHSAPMPARIPLVAREDAWDRLQGAWHQANQQGPRLALIQGEAGIGKTRLAEEMLLWAERQGFTTAVATCYAAQGRLPYAPITTWLRTDAIQKTIHRLSDKWLVEIARLLPELLAERPSLTPPGPLTEGWQRQHFFTALAQMILQIRRPLLLCMDDLQWADQDTLEWLHFLLTFDPQAHFLLLGTVRIEEVEANHPLIRLQQQLRRDDYLVEISLARLNREATCSLANHVLGEKVNASQAAWLYAETEGNPLFVVEMARTGLPQWRDGQSHPVAGLPNPVRSILEMRLTQLSPEARELAGLAATIGRSFTFDLLAAAGTQDEEMLVAGLDELWQRHIVREQGGESYDFSHGKLRQAAYERLSRVHRRLYHRRIVAALEAGCDGSPDEVSHQLAAHYEAMGSYAEAIKQYRQAAAVAQRVFAHQETLVHLQKVLALLPQVEADGEMWAALYRQQAAVLSTMGEYEEARAVLETAVTHTSNPTQHARLLCQQGDIWSAQQQQDAALAAYDQALTVLGAQPVDNVPEWWQVWLDVQLCRTTAFYFLSRLPELAELIALLQIPITEHGTLDQRRRFLDARNMLVFRQKRYRLDADDVATCQEIWSLAKASKNVQVMTAGEFAVGFACLWSGDPAQAVVFLASARQQAAESGNLYLHNQALAYLTQAYRALGDVAQVRKLVAPHECVAAQANNPFYSGMLAGQRAWLAVQEGKWETAVSHGKKALSIWGKLPFPLKCIGWWPLLASALAQSRLADAVEYAVNMLHPSQQLLDDSVTAELQQAICAWEGGETAVCHHHLKTAINLAQSAHTF